MVFRCTVSIKKIDGPQILSYFSGSTSSMSMPHEDLLSAVVTEKTPVHQKLFKYITIHITNICT